MSLKQKSLVKFNEKLTLPKDALRILSGSWLLISPCLPIMSEFNLFNLHSHIFSVLALGFFVLAVESFCKQALKRKEN